jgi:DNA polymerase I
MSIVNRCDSTEAVGHRMIKQPAASVPDGVSVVNNSVKQLSVPSGSEVEAPWLDSSLADNPLVATELALEFDDKAYDGDKKEHKVIAKKVISSLPVTESLSKESVNAWKALAGIYDKVMIVDNIESARNVVQLLTTKYKSFIHACDTEVK